MKRRLGQMASLDLLSIGDATIDNFMTPLESETLCEINTKECYIAFSFGEKIPVKNLEFSAGGNAANNAMGASRLGLSVGIVLTLGDDSIGAMIAQKLKEERVDLTYVTKQPATASNYSAIINYSGERTIFTYHAPRSYEFPVDLPTPPWVYLTSMGESFMPFYNHFEEWIKINSQIKLAFNPGSWQIRSGHEGIGGVLKLTHLIFVNREEAEKLTGMGETGGKEKELLLALSKLGPKISVITDGARGSFAYNSQEQKYVKVGIMPIDAYERTGAGDSFGSGCLAALVKGKTLEEALLWGTVNSASVVGYTGSQKGLLRETEIPEWLARAKSSGVVVETI